MAEGLNSITKVRGSQLFKLLFSPFNPPPPSILSRSVPMFRFETHRFLSSLSTLWSHSSYPVLFPSLPSRSRAFTATSRFFNMQHASHWDNTKRERGRERGRVAERGSWCRGINFWETRTRWRGGGRRMENERNNEGNRSISARRWQLHALWDNVFPVDPVLTDYFESRGENFVENLILCVGRTW